MILEIVEYGHPTLRQKGTDVREINEEIRNLAESMIETMHDADGVGLAAQQVNVAKRLFVLDVRQSENRPSTMWEEGKEVDFDARMPMVLINPEITISGDWEIEEEGCLSFPGIGADVRRRGRVKVRATNLEGQTISFEASGLLARAVQHEFDHVNGILFIDRLDSSKKASLAGKLKRLRAGKK